MAFRRVGSLSRRIQPAIVPFLKLSIRRPPARPPGGRVDQVVLLGDLPLKKGPRRRRGGYKVHGRQPDGPAGMEGIWELAGQAGGRAKEGRKQVKAGTRLRSEPTD